MHRYAAKVSWSRAGATFTDARYSRAHRWEFDGGAVVAGSSSPLSVPLPWSDPAAVDPEEALVASASSCHMLWFLALAAKRRYVVESYVDDAYGEMGPGTNGKPAIVRIVLRPRIEFAEPRPGAADLEALHHAAHDECYIANSLKAAIVVEAPAD